MRLFTELKRRNVFRVAAAYAVVAWLLIQLGDIAADNLGFPAWFMPMLFVLLGLGFPVALLLSWAFELTPEGVKRSAEVDEADSVTPKTGRRIDRLILVGLLAVIAVLVIERVWFAPGGEAPAVPATAALSAAEPGPGAAAALDKSIAVLPFSDFSPGGDQGWFADGLAEEILNALARTPDLKVASRTAAFAFRGGEQSLAEIGAALKVAHILEGSVRRADDHIRVTAQLIRVADGYHLWSENFDGSTKDVIAIQEKIAFEIARALKTAMDPDALAAMLAAGTRSVEAWEAWLKSQALFQQTLTTLDVSYLEPMRAAAERAVEIDPSFSRAHGFLAEFWRSQLDPTDFFFGTTERSPDEIRARFDTHIEAAIGAAGSEAEGLGYQAKRAGFRMQLAEQVNRLRQAVALRPQQADIHIALSDALIQTGQYAEAREALLKAAELGRDTNAELSLVIERLHRVDPAAALPLIDRALAAGSDSLTVLYQSHRALLHAGRVERAAEVARAYLLRDPDSTQSRFVRVRQACAEGRIAEAEALYRDRNNDTNQWMLLKTLGRDAEARDVLRPLDTPDRLYGLSSYLSYTFFDPADFPLLADTLARQGVKRPPPRPIRFACKRTEADS